MNLIPFQTRFAELGKSPQGALHMLFEALVTLQDDIALAEQQAALVFNGQQLYRQADAPSGWDVGNSVRFLLQQLKAKPHIVASYLGGTPQQHYRDADLIQLPLNYPAENSLIGGIRVKQSAMVEGANEGQLTILSSGKDLPTVIYLAKNARGLWKIDTRSLSNIATGVKAPTPEDF